MVDDVLRPSAPGGPPLNKALERPPGEREELIDRRAGDNEDLRREVRSLLAADTNLIDHLDTPRVELLAPLDERRESHFGPYEIVRELAAAEPDGLHSGTHRRGVPQASGDQGRPLRRQVRCPPAFPRRARSSPDLDHPNSRKSYGAEPLRATTHLSLAFVDGLADRRLHEPRLTRPRVSRASPRSGRPSRSPTGTWWSTAISSRATPVDRRANPSADSDRQILDSEASSSMTLTTRARRR